MTNELDAEFAGSWWGREWIESLHRLSTAWQNRLPRGRDYAAKGHVISLAVAPGKITAAVQGSRSKPYKTEIELPTFDEKKWDELVSVLSEQAHYPAQLLAGQMPEGINVIFENINLNLFPTRNSELLAQCNCPDKARPCKHIAAVHYAFGKALDRDPFVLFLLRGADRQMLLRRFRHFWFGTDIAADVADGASTEGADRDGSPVMPMTADRFNRSPDDEAEISVYIERPAQPLFIMQRLGNPPSWNLPIDIDALLGPVIEEASKLAFNFATDQGLREGEAEDRPDASTSATDEQPSALDPLFRAFEMPDLPRSGASLSAPPAPIALPTSLPAADLLTGVIGVDLDADKKNQSKKLRSSTKTPKPAAGAVLIRKGTDGAPTVRKRRKVVGASTQPAAPTDAPQERATPKRRAGTKKTGADSAAEQRQKLADSIAPESVKGAATAKSSAAVPVVRRRRKVAGAVTGDTPAQRRKKLAKFDKAAHAAWNTDDADSAFSNTMEAWQIEPSEARYMMLVANRDEIDNADTLLEAEAKRLVGVATRRGRRVSIPELLLLLTVGKYTEATELVSEMGDEIWRGETPVGTIFMPFGLMALVAERTVPDESALSGLWDELFNRGEEHFADFENEPAPIGAWLEWSLDDHPLDEELEEQLRSVVKSCAAALIECARTEPLTLNPAQVAAYIVAVAEALRLTADEAECDQFVAIASARSASVPALGRAMQLALSNSSLMGYHS